MARACSTSATDTRSVSRSCSMVCSMRDVHPGPRIRRATIWSTSSVGPPSPAILRSGPCDFEKLRMCSTWPGSQLPRLTSPAVAISPEWSSSSTIASLAWCERRMTAASCSARSGVRDRPVGFCALGCSTIAVGRSVRASASRSGRIPSASTPTGTRTAPKCSSRSKMGGNPGSSTTTRSPKRTTSSIARDRASRAPSTTVIVSTGYGQVSRSTCSSSGMTGWSR